MNVKLAPPWIEYMSKISALFERDPDIKIIKSDGAGNPEIRLLVNGQKKYDALVKLLPMEKWFGNVCLKIVLVPSNEQVAAPSTDLEALYRDAFAGNPIVSQIVPIKGVFSNNFAYIAFVKEVVQFFNDNLGDIHGNKNTLFETIANEIFESKKDGICFCTDVDPKLGKPLGEWP